MKSERRPAYECVVPDKGESWEINPYQGEPVTLPRLEERTADGRTIDEALEDSVPPIFFPIIRI